MDHADQEVLKMYESRNGRCASEKAVQLFVLHNREVKKAYQQGYLNGKNATFVHSNTRLG